MKKAQEFLLDTALGEKKFELEKPQEEKIVLSIEEGAVPVSALNEMRAKSGPKQNVFKRFDEALKSLGKPNAKERAAFFRLMAIMINAGIPLIKSLDTIAEQTTNHKLRLAIFAVARSIEKGSTLSGSMAKFPGIFSESQLGMIHSGEASGQLNKILSQLATEVEKSAAIIGKVRGAMIYPAFIMSVMLLVVSGMMVFVVPKIADVFSQSGQQLPLLTRIVIGTSNFMSQRWPWIFGGIFGLVFALMGAQRTKEGRYATDWFLIHAPLIGPLIKKSILSRFSRSLGNLLSSGIPIIETLHINGKGLGNELYRRRIELAVEDVSKGIPLGESLRDSPEFPTMMVQMISVGEQTAQLDHITTKIAEFYEGEVDTAVASISKIIEPFILVFLGVVVGGIVGAIMMPIIQLSQNSGSL